MTLFSPVGRESRDTFRRTLPAFAFALLAGASLTAAMLWLLAGLASPIPNSLALGILVIVLVLLVLREMGVVRFWLPETHRQIPQSVLHQDGVIPALQFGFELGMGVRTYAPTMAPYMVASAVLLLHPPWWSAMAVAGGFALGRAAMPTVRLLSGDPVAWDVRLEARIRTLTATSAIVTAALLGGGAVLNLS